MSSHDALRSDDSFPVIVKNTFIHVGIEEETPTRRCSSTPPSSRSSMPNFKMCPSESGDSDMYGFDKLSSNSERTLTNGRVSTNSDGMEIMSHNVPSGDGNPNGATSLRLNRNARPYQPGASCFIPMPVQDLTTNYYEEMMAHIVMTVASAMSAFTKVETAVQPIDGKKGWLLDTWLAATDAHYVSPVLAHTKQILLRAAEESTNVYALGYKTNPFKNTEHGFEAMLGIMQDPSRACWDAYGNGYCQRGTNCRWEHPVIRKHIYVAVRPWPKPTGNDN